MSNILGYQIHGNGPKKVVVLHDWYCDHTSWDFLIPLLNTKDFTYAFADLRGYGFSKDIAGTCTLEEATQDTIVLAESLGWAKFSLVGHSMSTVVSQNVLQRIPRQIEKLVAVTPVAPQGLQCDQSVISLFQSLALADDEKRFATMAPMWGNRYSEEWIRFKLSRWRETANPEAAAKYVELWGCTDITRSVRSVDVPVLIIAGAHDSPPFRAEALKQTMVPHYPAAELVPFPESGHYPMQEQPPLLASTINRFLAR